MPGGVIVVEPLLLVARDVVFWGFLFGEDVVHFVVDEDEVYFIPPDVKVEAEIESVSGFEFWVYDRGEGGVEIHWVLWFQRLTTYGVYLWISRLL